VGDFYQLQPVGAPYIFDQIGDAYTRLHQPGSLWVHEFSMIELTEIMRQKEVGEFAKLLSGPQGQVYRTRHQSALIKVPHQ